MPDVGMWTLFVLRTGEGTNGAEYERVAPNELRMPPPIALRDSVVVFRSPLQAAVGLRQCLGLGTSMTRVPVILLFTPALAVRIMAFPPLKSQPSNWSRLACL